MTLGDEADFTKYFATAQGVKVAGPVTAQVDFPFQQNIHGVTGFAFIEDSRARAELFRFADRQYRTQTLCVETLEERDFA